MQKATLPALSLTGGCQCGRIRYRITGHPLAFYLCHCTECQRQTSSAFGESLRCRSEHLGVEGDLRCVERTSNSGKTRQGWFCPDCGVRIYHATLGSNEINLKAGTLDDTSWLMPAGHIWTSSKQPFVYLHDDELCYPHQPEDNYAALKDQWQQMTDGAYR